MKIFFSGLISIFFLACSKKDVIRIVNEIKKERCQAISMNSDKQETSDFYVVKTFDDNRILKHVKTQLRDLSGNTRLYDFDISYKNGKAIFKGSVKTLLWMLDNPPYQDPNGPPADYDPDAPEHPVEQTELRDNRSFEVSLDRRTGFATEIRYVGKTHPELTLVYNNNGRLTRVNDYFVDMDDHGNIVSMLLPYPGPGYPSWQRLGVSYRYNVTQRNKRQYYEAPFIFIHPFFSLLEILDWGPFQPVNERTGVSIRYNYMADDLPPWIPEQIVDAEYSNHRYDENKNLISYDFDGDLSNPIPYMGFRGHRSRTILWTCINQAK